MADLVFVLVAVAFFGLCVLYIKGCERILGSGDEGTDNVDGVTQ